MYSGFNGESQVAELPGICHGFAGGGAHVIGKVNDVVVSAGGVDQVCFNVCKAGKMKGVRHPALQKSLIFSFNRRLASTHVAQPTTTGNTHEMLLRKSGCSEKQSRGEKQCSHNSADNMLYSSQCQIYEKPLNQCAVNLIFKEAFISYSTINTRSVVPSL